MYDMTVNIEKLCFEQSARLESKIFSSLVGTAEVIVWPTYKSNCTIKRKKGKTVSFKHCSKDKPRIKEMFYLLKKEHYCSPPPHTS